MKQETEVRAIVDGLKACYPEGFKHQRAESYFIFRTVRKISGKKAAPGIRKRRAAYLGKARKTCYIRIVLSLSQSCLGIHVPFKTCIHVRV